GPIEGKHELLDRALLGFRSTVAMLFHEDDRHKAFSWQPPRPPRNFSRIYLCQPVQFPQFRQRLNMSTASLIPRNFNHEYKYKLDDGRNAINGAGSACCMYWLVQTR